MTRLFIIVLNASLQFKTMELSEEIFVNIYSSSQWTVIIRSIIIQHLAGKETVAKAPIPDKSCLCCQVEETQKSTGDTDETLPCDKGDVSAFSKTETFKPVVQKQDMREGRLVEVDDKKPPRPNTCAQFHAISPRPSPVKTNRTQVI